MQKLDACLESWAADDRRSLAQWLELLVEAEDARRSGGRPVKS
jgi:hypothetical protein